MNNLKQEKGFLFSKYFTIKLLAHTVETLYKKVAGDIDISLEIPLWCPYTKMKLF